MKNEGEGGGKEKKNESKTTLHTAEQNCREAVGI